MIAPRTRRSLVELAESLPVERFYASASAAEEALRQRGMFNVIDVETGVKLDLMSTRARANLRPSRLRREAEDTILAKLEWAKLGESERHLRDVESILSVEERPLDHAYIAEWARELGVTELWERVRREAAER